MAVARGSVARMRPALWVLSLKGYRKNMSSGYFLALLEFKSWKGGEWSAGVQIDHKLEASRLQMAYGF